MFLHLLRVERISESGRIVPVPVKQIDNFCMRNFTNDVLFDDTLPIADGLLEVGSLVPLDRLSTAMEAWFRRKGYLSPSEHLSLKKLSSSGDT